MHDEDKPGRAQDPVEEASGESFPASDPPAWTAARAGKPEHPERKQARRADQQAAPRACEVVGLFRSEAEAKPAAEALLNSGFNRVDIGPPRWHGNLGAGVGAPVPVNRTSSLGVCAALGALAAGALAALLLPRGSRHVLAAAAGGAVGAVSAHAAARLTQKQVAEPGWPAEAVLVRVMFNDADEQKRAVSILEAQGACKLHLNLPQAL